VREGVLDLTFATLDELATDLVSLPLLRSPLMVVSSAEGKLGRRRTIGLAALADAEQVGFAPGWGVRTLVDQAVRSVGLEPRVDLEVNDTDTLLDLVEAGLGIALIPEVLARLRPNLHRIAITDGKWDWTIAAHAVAPLPVNPAARAFWNSLPGWTTC
jgi:DNA-binding transcriptional LysR family regulator